jgi:hypothetical protein
MKNVKMLFTAIAVVAIAGGAIAAKHKNNPTYYSCSSSLKCTVSHNILNINELQTTSDATHPNAINDATLNFGQDCSASSNCGTLFYGTGQ